MSEAPTKGSPHARGEISSILVNAGFLGRCWGDDCGELLRNSHGHVLWRLLVVGFVCVVSSTLPLHLSVSSSLSLSLFLSIDLSLFLSFFLSPCPSHTCFNHLSVQLFYTLSFSDTSDSPTPAYRTLSAASSPRTWRFFPIKFPLVSLSTHHAPCSIDISLPRSLT